MKLLLSAIFLVFLFGCSSTLKEHELTGVNDIDGNQTQSNLANSINETVDAMTNFLVFSGSSLDKTAKSLLDTTFDAPLIAARYSINTIAGIDYPKKNGKIYLQSTTLEDTKGVTPENAQLYGFDNVVINDVLQCDSLPEFTDVLLEHEWEITEVKEEADYIVSLSTTYCGWPKDELRASRRTLKIEERFFYNKMLELSGVISLDNNVTLQNEEFKQYAPLFNVKNHNHFFNPFNNKYSTHLGSIKNMYRTGINSYGSGSVSSVNTGSLEGDVFAAVIGGMLQNSLSSSNKVNSSIAGYQTEVKVFNPDKNTTDTLYMDGFAMYNSGYETYYETVEKFASGVFFK